MPKQVVRTLVARVCCAAALQVKQIVKQPRGVDVLEALVVVVEGPAAAEALDGLVDAVVGGLRRAVMMSMSF